MGTINRVPRLVFQIAAIVSGALVLGGCFFRSNPQNCKSVEEYQNSENIAPVQVPEGLTRPDPGGRMQIPAGPLPQEPLEQNAACLARPPDYFKKAPAKPGN